MEPPDESDAILSANTSSGVSAPVTLAIVLSTIAVIALIRGLSWLLEFMRDARHRQFYSACRNGDVATLRRLLSSKGSAYDVNRRDANGDAALHHAATNPTPDAIDAISYLLECGADPAATNSLGRIPLHVACEHGASHAVTSLLDVSAATGSTATGSTVLTAGSSVTDEATATGGAAAVHVRDDEGCTPLHLAVACRREGQAEEVVRCLLEKGADVWCRDDRGRTALHAAAEEKGGHSIIATLLQGSAFLSQWVRSSGELDARDEEGKAAMHMAVECRDVDAVRVLLRSGAQADVAQTGTGYTPLHSLVLQPRSPSLSSDDLAANGSSSSLSYPPAGSEKLSISRRGSRRLSSSFHAPPAADTLSASRVFNTHLDLSISRKNSLPAEGNGYKYYLSGRNGDDREELVRCLLGEGRADVNRRDAQGDTPLTLAVRCNDLVMAELLMEGKGVDVSGAWALAAENKEANRDLLQLLQEPALIAEEVHGRVLSMVNLCNLRGLRRLLLCHSPNPDEIRLTDPWTKQPAPGYTPLALAAHAGRVEVVRFLVEEAKASTGLLTSSGRSLLHIVASLELFDTEPPPPNAGNMLGTTAFSLTLATSGSQAGGEKDKGAEAGGNSNPPMPSPARTTRAGSIDRQVSASNGGGGPRRQRSLSGSYRRSVSRGPIGEEEDARAVEILRYLVEEAGVDPCQCDWDGNTAADVARQHQRQALVTYLETVIPEDRYLASARNGDLATLQSLLQSHPHRLNGDVTDRLLQRTALHWAACNGHLDVAEYLVMQVLVRVNATDANGDSAVMLAARNGHEHVASFLRKEYTGGRRGHHHDRSSSGVARWAIEMFRESKDALWGGEQRRSNSQQAW